MNVKNLAAMICMMAILGNVNATSYILVSGNQITVNTQSNLAVDFGLSTYEPDLEPGDRGTLTLVLMNTGTQSARNVQLHVPSSGPIRVDKKFFLGDIRHGVPTTVSMTYHIDKDAKVGTYTVPVRLTYDGYRSDGSAVSNIHTNYDFPINVHGKPNIAIEDLMIENPVIGGNAKVTVAIKNMGQDARNVVALMSSPSPGITILGADRRFIGDIGSKMAAEIEYELYISDSVVSGALSLPFIVEYENRGRTKHAKTFNIGLYLSGKADISITDIKTDPDRIHAADENVRVSLKVENIGSREVKDMTVTLKPEYPFKEARSYIQSISLGLMKPRDYSNVAFDIDVADGADPGIHELEFLIEYSVGGEPQSIRKPLMIIIHEKPSFTVASEPLSLFPNERGMLHLSVENTGQDCESVTVWIMKRRDHPFDFDDMSHLVGDLDSKKSGQAVFGFFVDDTALPKEYIIPLEIRCAKNGKVFIESESITLGVLKGSGSGVGTIAFALSVFALIIFLMVWAGKRALSGLKK